MTFMGTTKSEFPRDNTICKSALNLPIPQRDWSAAPWQANTMWRVLATHCNKNSLKIFFIVITSTVAAKVEMFFPFIFMQPWVMWSVSACRSRSGPTVKRFSKCTWTNDACIHTVCADFWSVYSGPGEAAFDPARVRSRQKPWTSLKV